METITIRHDKHMLTAWHRGRHINAPPATQLRQLAPSVLEYAKQFDRVKVTYKRPNGPQTTADTTLFRKDLQRGLLTSTHSWGALRAPVSVAEKGTGEYHCRNRATSERGSNGQTAH